MTKYIVPPKPKDPVQRFVVVTDEAEIAAIIQSDLRAPIGKYEAGQWWAEVHSLRQFRGLPVEFDV